MICDTIKELRERAGLSQAALAKKVGVTRSAVNAWEIGLSIPTTQYVAELAQFFHVSSDYILGLDKTESVYIGNLSNEEKRILYSLLNYFQDK
jgi:transcriptional regulator with XRE-family HTH domain